MAMNYFENHIGDYDQATAHLTGCEDGMYGRMIRWYMASEKPLPADLVAIQRRTRAHTREEKAAVATILQEFFVLGEDGYHQHRCDVEIARFHDKQRKARASADARWSKVPTASERNATDDAPIMRTHMRTHPPSIADGMHRAPVPSPQSPDPILNTNPLPSVGGSGSPQSVDPPTPPPAFDGKNGEALNCKSVVPLAVCFELPEPWGMDAEALGWKPSEVLREAEKYRQYWVAGRGAGTRRSVKGWRQTWSTWLGKAAKDMR